MSLFYAVMQYTINKRVNIMCYGAWSLLWILLIRSPEVYPACKCAPVIGNPAQPRVNVDNKTDKTKNNSLRR